MEQQLINELNQRIIKQFEEKEKDLQLKIDTFNEYLDNEKLTDDLLENLKEIISDIRNAKNKISRQIKRMKEKNQKGMSLIKNTDKRYKNILTDSKYQRAFDFVENNGKNVEKRIDRLEDLSDKINSDSKIGISVKNNLEKRISNLKNKKGKIQNRQTKIIDLATKEKLNSYIKNIKKADTISSLLLKTSEKSIEKQSKIDILSKEKEELTNMKKQLFSGNLVDKGLGVRVLFNEKLTEGKIKALQTKKGVIDFTNKQLIKSGVKAPLIEKMKNKVISFSKNIGNSLKTTANKVTEFFELPPEPIKTK
ncbi:MAG: hypothetical protein IJZ79_07390 [Bacilli bacterium]|nr:hypothetical protein [Bacilli bacterium]